MNANRLNLSIVTLLIALLFVSLSAGAQVKDSPCIDLNAEAKCEVMPDELVLSITVREADYKGRQTVEEKQKELIGVLKANDVDYAEQLSIYQMGSSISVKAYSKKIKTRSEVVYLLTLHDAETMQNVIEDLEAVEISNIRLISTKYTKSDELKTRLGIEALQKARAEAVALAGALDQEIGSAMSISSWMTNDAPRHRTGIMYAPKYSNDEVMAEGAVVEKPEVPGLKKITYTVTVSVKFLLKIKQD